VNASMPGPAPAQDPGTPSAQELDAARLVLARMGIRVEDLLTRPCAQGLPVESRAPVPTFAEYVPVVSGAVSEGTRRVYSTYWKRLLEHWGDRRIDEPTPSQIQELSSRLRAQRVVRRNGRGGQLTGEHFIAALRCLYRHAIADGLVSDNPAARVDKPRRPASTRQAVGGPRLAEINQVAASTGNDPVLDSLLIRLHTETACRRGGALALRPMDIDEQQCLIRLREKGETTRWQPVSPTLMRHLLAHARERGAQAGGQLLRYRDGRPITRRRYDYLWTRIGQHLPWVAAQGVSAHWLRHTTLTWVERTHGYAVAQAYAGHSGGRTGDGVTATYVRATLHEVAAALAALTGEPHPLAHPLAHT
jgi:integrase/recombinase XerC